MPLVPLSQMMVTPDLDVAQHNCCETSLGGGPTGRANQIILKLADGSRQAIFEGRNRAAQAEGTQLPRSSPNLRCTSLAILATAFSPTTRLLCFAKQLLASNQAINDAPYNRRLLVCYFRYPVGGACARPEPRSAFLRSALRQSLAAPPGLAGVVGVARAAVAAALMGTDRRVSKGQNYRYRLPSSAEMHSPAMDCDVCKKD